MVRIGNGGLDGDPPHVRQTRPENVIGVSVENGRLIADCYQTNTPLNAASKRSRSSIVL